MKKDEYRMKKKGGKLINEESQVKKKEMKRRMLKTNMYMK